MLDALCSHTHARMLYSTVKWETTSGKPQRHGLCYTSACYAHMHAQDIYIHTIGCSNSYIKRKSCDRQNGRRCTHLAAPAAKPKGKASRHNCRHIHTADACKRLLSTIATDTSFQPKQYSPIGQSQQQSILVDTHCFQVISRIVCNILYRLGTNS